MMHFSLLYSAATILDAFVGNPGHKTLKIYIHAGTCYAELTFCFNAQQTATHDLCDEETFLMLSPFQ